MLKLWGGDGAASVLRLSSDRWFSCRYGLQLSRRYILRKLCRKEIHKGVCNLLAFRLVERIRIIPDAAGSVDEPFSR